MSETAEAPATAAPAAPAPAAPVAPVAAPVPAGPEWLGQADPDIVGHAQNLGWKTPADAVKSHRELQKLFGADKHGRTFTIPKDEADAEGWNAVYSKLGRPEAPDAYGIKAPEGSPPEFATQAAQWFHEAGLNTKQGQALAGKWGEFVTAQQAAMDAQAQEALKVEHEALAKDWGTGPAAAMQKEVARRAAAKLGLDEGAVDALEQVVGFSKVMKAFAKVGELMGEHKFEGADGTGAFGMTPEMAQAKRSQLMADPEFRAKAMSPNSAEWAQLQRMDRILAGG